jgi:hypothetical protein
MNLPTQMLPLHDCDISILFLLFQVPSDGVWCSWLDQRRTDFMLRSSAIWVFPHCPAILRFLSGSVSLLASLLIVLHSFSCP